jgi:hypothetical protein
MKYKHPKNYLFIFLLLLIIFLTPLILALVLYNKNPLWLHQKTVNKGTLISAGTNLHKIKLISDQSTSRSFNQSWFLFYLTTSPCRQYCKKNLHTLRQITIALGKNSFRVKYGLILANNKPLTNHNLINKDLNLYIYNISKPELKKYFSILKISKYSDAYYLADPFGKIILYYPKDVTGEDIYQDLSRLLTISTTG